MNMENFYEGMIAMAAIIGAITALIYWFFNVLEKRLENKLDTVGGDVHRIANELREERRSRDNMYSFVLQNYSKKGM